jgi:hypothetical protein
MPKIVKEKKSAKLRHSPLDEVPVRKTRKTKQDVGDDEVLDDMIDVHEAPLPEKLSHKIFHQAKSQREEEKETTTVPIKHSQTGRPPGRHDNSDSDFEVYYIFKTHIMNGYRR